jgi:hypothetical protein
MTDGFGNENADRFEVCSSLSSTRMRSLRHRLVRHAAISFIPAVCAVSPAAHAHGGIPRAFEIQFGPDNPKNVLIRSDIWGLMRSTDGGQSWQWSCAEVYGGNSLSADNRPMLLGQNGRILVAGESSGLQITDDFCSWTGVPMTSDAGKPELVADVNGTGADAYLLTSTNFDGNILGRVRHSADNGQSWSVVGTPLPSDFGAATVAVAPSNRTRFYVSGRKLDVPDGTVETSADGGNTWTRSTFPITLDVQRVAAVRIVLVHPTRPDVLLVWVDSPEVLGVNSPDDLWASGDGGKTWKDIYSSKGDLPGHALSPDGTELLISGPLEGVQSANLDDALAKGRAAFTQVFTGGVWGLDWVADGSANGKLYAGNDNFTAAGIPAYTLGVSTDRGHTFAPLMTVCDITYATCAPTSLMNQACNELWNEAYPTGFKADFAENVRCVSPDAGATSAHRTSTTSSCSIATLGTSTSPATFEGLLVALWLIARRRVSRA